MDCQPRLLHRTPDIDIAKTVPSGVPIIKKTGISKRCFSQEYYYRYFLAEVGVLTNAFYLDIKYHHIIVTSL